MTQEGRARWLLGAMSGVLGLVVLDETVVGTALATIGRDLELGRIDGHWVVNAYLLAFTVFVAFGGWLGDRLGHRASMTAGLLTFGLASLAAGSAPSGAWLIGARAVEGLGAALIFPACFAIMTRAFPKERRGRALGIQTTVAALFMAAGPLVGGLFSETLSWRWIFWINLPLTLAVALVLRASWWPAIDAGHDRRRGPVDLAGLAALAGGLGALVTALMEGPDWGWRAPGTLGLGAAGLALLAAFVAIERRGPAPLVRLDLLRIRAFTGGNLVFFAFQFDKIAVFVFVALFLQEVRHVGPIASGLVVLVAVLPSLLTSAMAGRLADARGSRPPLLLGLAINGASLLLLAGAMSLEPWWLVVLPLLAWGTSLPMLAVPSRRALMGAVPAAEHGAASGVNLTIQMLGGTVGMALCGALVVITGDYRAVFLATAAAVFAAMALATWLIRRAEDPV